MNARDEVVDWLRDAYAMERGLEVTLKKISESESHPVEIRHSAAMHLDETQRHAEMVASLLKSLGTDTSTVKTGIGLMTETMKGIGTALSHDEPIKDLLAGYSMEHFEIACYRALAVAAESAGLPEVGEACKEIIADEEKMANKLNSLLPEMVRRYLGGETMTMAA